MENLDANQLPEVDSLPDGFVDSSREPVAPATPTMEQEKLPSHNKDDAVSDVCHPNLELEAGLELSNETTPSHGGTPKSEKTRTFPVPLSEADGLDASGHMVDVPVEQDEDIVRMPASGNHIAEASRRATSDEVKEVIHGDRQSSEKAVPATADLQNAEHIELQGSRKQESSESKRKNVKKTFKSEKEFLEFTLKYQQVLSERDSAIIVRDKLESLCRELQRQNKVLMDECKRVSTEGQSLRLDLSARFQDAIKDVSSKLEEQKEDSLAQLRENEMLRTKLKQLADQYTLSEQHFAQKLKQKSLELQISDLKIKQHEEKLVQEQSQMKIYAEQVSQLHATEKNLRLQLTSDGEKFQQFQETLMKSNEVFETYKQEIDKMAKSIKELKKENTFLKGKCDKTDVTLIELVEERERLKKQLEKTKNQKEKLESLCRSLQAERKQSSIPSPTPIPTTTNNVSDSEPVPE
ncbi:TXLNA [Linum grandiflorum]